MRRLVRLLPNLTFLRGPTDDEKVLVELVACPPRPLRNIINFKAGPGSLAALVSLLERSSSTVKYVGLMVSDPTPDAIVHNPPTYPSLNFPSLTKLTFRSYQTLTSKPFLLSLAASRWSLPILETLDVNASPFLLPFLHAHGVKIRQLGLRTQGVNDHGSYEEWFQLCPNLETLAWTVWEPEKGQRNKPVELNIQQPVLSVRTITVAQTEWSQDYSPSSWICENVPSTINKEKFPSLTRVVFSNRFNAILKT